MFRYVLNTVQNMNILSIIPVYYQLSNIYRIHKNAEGQISTHQPQIKQGSICETRKGPNRPRFEMVLTISFMSMFWKIQYFWPTSGGRNSQKAHLHTKTFHLNLFTCLYDHWLQRYSPERLFSKNHCFWTFQPISAIFGGRIWPKLSKGTSTGLDLSYEHIPRSLQPFVTE